MPVRRTTKDGKPAYQWGESGKKYTYKSGDPNSRRRAKELAEMQGKAIEMSKRRAKGG